VEVFEEYEKSDHMTDYKTQVSMFLIVISRLSICGSFSDKYKKTRSYDWLQDPFIKM